MERGGRIITVGVAPAWDVGCRGRDLDWGCHVEIDAQTTRPAGKSVNISYALAWMGRESIAAGLWGRDDYAQMQAATARLGGLVQAQMTPTEGRTRQNVTVVDTVNRREMHLRVRNPLASTYNLKRLYTDLSRLIGEEDFCVFAGSMPGGALLDSAVDLLRVGRNCGAWIAVDTHGPVLQQVVQEGLARLIAPNVGELRELLGAGVGDGTASLVEAGRRLLAKTGMVLISRGEKGAILVTADGVWTGRSQAQREVLLTVGCGDYLLAGFLADLRRTGDPRAALATGLTVATAKAWGWTEGKTWPQVREEVAIVIERV